MGAGGLIQDLFVSFTRVPRALTPPALWSLIDGVGRSVGLFPLEVPAITVEQVPEAVIIARADGRIATANSRAATLFGRNVAELAEMTLAALFRVVPAKNGSEGFELLGSRQDGQEFYADVHAHIISRAAPGDTVIAVVRDMAAKHVAEDRHNADERRLRLALETGQIGTWEVDVQASTAEWDERLHRMFGLAPRSFRGTIEAFLELVHSDDRAKVADSIMRATQEAEPFELDFRAMLPDGRTRYMSSRADVIRDERGRAARIAGVCTDVTERVYAQQRLQRAHDELERRVSERTEDLNRSIQELDDFAHIVSHDLKEPLRGIHNYARFIIEDEKGELGDKARHRLDRISYLANRMNDLVDSILENARVGHLAIEPDVDVRVLVADVVATLDALLAENKVKLHLAAVFPAVACDRQRVAEVFRNLVTNAIKYNDKSEKIIEVGCTDAGMLPGPAFYVRDNGIGIEAAHFRSVFDMFRRLHGRDEFGGGTGAGLAIAKKIVELHGGRMWVESTVGEGSTFFFTVGNRAQAAVPSSLDRTLPVVIGGNDGGTQRR
jgi:PAS domain S-box-containing protein